MRGHSLAAVFHWSIRRQHCAYGQIRRVGFHCAPRKDFRQPRRFKVHARLASIGSGCIGCQLARARSSRSGNPDRALDVRCAPDRFIEPDRIQAINVDLRPTHGETLTAKAGRECRWQSYIRLRLVGLTTSVMGAALHASLCNKCLNAQGTVAGNIARASPQTKLPRNGTLRGNVALHPSDRGQRRRPNGSMW